VGDLDDLNAILAEVCCGNREAFGRVVRAYGLPLRGFLMGCPLSVGSLAPHAICQVVALIEALRLRTLPSDMPVIMALPCSAFSRR